MINIQNIDDNECFKWSIVRYLIPANQYQGRIAKAYKDLAEKLDFKDKKFLVKIRDIHKIEKKNSIDSSVLAMKIKKNMQSMYQKNVAKKNMLIYY